MSRSARFDAFTDENLSPQLAAWANDQGLEASAAIYVGLQGKPDIQLWRHAYAHSQIVVTVNSAR